MNPQSVANIAWITAIVGLALVEAYLLTHNWSLSQSNWRASLRRPIIPFLAGLLAGHLYWQSDACNGALAMLLSLVRLG